MNYENKAICEILSLIDGEWSLLKKGEKEKIFCIHRYFQQVNNITQQKNSEEKRLKMFEIFV